MGRVFGYLTTQRGFDQNQVAEALYADSCRITGKVHVPHFLRGLVSPNYSKNKQNNDGAAAVNARLSVPARQQRHLTST